MSVITDREDVITSAVLAGRAATAAANRIVEFRESEGAISVPIAFDADGQPVVLTAVRDYMRAEQPLPAGTYQHRKLESLIAWSDRYAIGGISSAYFSSPVRGKGSVTVVVDDLPDGKTGSLRRLRGTFAVNLHERLRAWKDLGAVDAGKFADFLEANVEELCSTDPISMVRNLSVKGETTWTRQADADGVVKITSEEKSGPAVKILRRFQIQVPVFAGDPIAQTSRFTVAITLRLQEKKPIFATEVIDLEPQVEAVFGSLHDVFEKACPTIYVYYGDAPS